MPLEPNQTLSHYRLIEKIGEGGMGVVWKAVDTNLDREVAIKVLPEALASDPDRLGRFEREAKLLASLNHSRIAALYGLHQASPSDSRQERIRFLSMELIQGEDLSQRLSRGPMPLEQSLRVALQVAEGLEAAHDSGIVHRDLKPANTKLTADGDVKILDFGLAKALHDPVPGGTPDLTQSPTMTAAATQAGVILGTAAYMSPEQSRGQEADRRTDVWAFGCLLYEMLTGSGVFRGPTASDCIAGILGREPDWAALPSSTPPGARRLLRRCLEKDPRERLHDIADARIELQEVIAGDREDALVLTAPSRGWGGSRVIWAIAGLAIGVIAAWALLPQRPATETATPIEAHVALPLPPDKPVSPDPADSSVAISPDGTLLVYVGLTTGTGSRDGNPSATVSPTQLYVRRLDDFAVRAIDGTKWGRAPFISPDGKWVGFVDSRDDHLKKVRLEGGVPVVLSEGAMGLDYRGFDWGDDGRIYFGGAIEGLESVPEDGGAMETLTHPDPGRGEKTHRFPHLLPEGRGLLFTLATSGISSYDESSVALLDPRTGKFRILFDGGTAPRYVSTGHIVYGRDGTLEAVPFDLDSLETTGPPFPVARGILTSDGWGSAHYAVSDTGTLAYVPGTPKIFHLPVYWLDQDGNLEAVDLPSQPYGTAAFSPDGKRLAFSVLGANASIWIYDIVRGTRTRLTSTWDNTLPIWMRNGTHVTFSSNRSDGNGLWRVAADGSGKAEMLAASDRFDWPLAWSAGDRWLAVTATGDSDIWLLTGKEGDEPEPLIESPFRESDASFSPDGNWLAYVSDDSGLGELYVQRFPPSGRKWQISVGGGEKPLWSPGGDALYYWKGNRLMTVSVALEPEFSPGREREISQPEFAYLADWDIAPDGKRFVIVGRTIDPGDSSEPRFRMHRALDVGTDVRELRVVLDWFAKLRRGPS